MDHTVHLLRFLLVLLLHRLTFTSASASATAAPPVTSSSPACSDKLVTFSTCLPFVGEAPNNLTDSPPPHCCDDVAAAFSDGSAVCLCYFVLRPEIFGFPLNATKVLSLTSICAPKARTTKANFSLKELCSTASSPLPSLQSITGLGNPTPPNLGANSPPPPPPSADSPPPPPPPGAHSPPPPPTFVDSDELSSDSSSTEEEPADELPSQPSSSTFPTTISSATHRMYRLRWSWLCFPVCIIISL